MLGTAQLVPSVNIQGCEPTRGTNRVRRKLTLKQQARVASARQDFRILLAIRSAPYWGLFDASQFNSRSGQGFTKNLFCGGGDTGPNSYGNRVRPRTRCFGKEYR
jgi:hypothetical protein